MDSTTELIDRSRINDLVLRVGVMLDDDRYADAPALFTDDVEISTPGGTARGVDAAIAQAQRNHSRTRTQHLITNVLIELDGDKAAVRANVHGTFVPTDDSRGPWAVLGAYEFEVARSEGTWRISSLKMDSVWHGAIAAA